MAEVLLSTVWQRVCQQARSCPERVALRRVDGASEIRYGALIDAASELAAALAARSVSRGSRVLVLSDNSPETYLCVLACAKLGAIAVLADHQLPLAALIRFGEITTPAVVLRMPSTSTDSLSPAFPSTPVILVDVGAGHLGAIDGVGEAADTDLGADDPLAIIFTSGTTGDPKAVLLANRTFFAIADTLHSAGLNWISWVAGESTYSPLPATHIGGLWWILNCLMQGNVCVTGGENTSSLAEILNTNAIATTCLVPTLLTRLVAEVHAGAPMPRLRMLGYGGSRAVASDVAFVEAAGVHTAQVFGLSETGCTALCLPTSPGSIDKIAEGAVGRPYPGVEVRLSGDHSRPEFSAPTDTVGTMWVKSPANMLGYWSNPERTDEVLSDGWIDTGDIVELREDGYFYIRGRSSEMIISGGVNVAPDEVDRIAHDVPGVAAAACFEIPDEEFGAVIGLAVVPSEKLDEPAARILKQAIAARYRDQSESQARPVKIVLVEDIPRTQSGKVMRGALFATSHG